MIENQGWVRSVNRRPKKPDLTVKQLPEALDVCRSLASGASGQRSLFHHEFRMSEWGGQDSACMSFAPISRACERLGVSSDTTPTYGSIMGNETVPGAGPSRRPKPPRWSKKWGLYVVLAVNLVLVLVLVGLLTGLIGGGSKSSVEVAGPSPSASSSPASTKEACSKHSKICFKIPNDWTSKVTLHKQGVHHMEYLKLFDEKGVARVTLENHYSVEKFNGGVRKLDCIGNLKRTVIAYSKVDLPSKQPNFGETYVAQAVVDEYDPDEMETYDGPVMFKPYVEVVRTPNQANKPGEFTIDCENVETRSIKFNFLEDNNSFIISTDLGAEPLATKEEALEVLKRPESMTTLEVVSSIYRKR